MPQAPNSASHVDVSQWMSRIRAWALELGFSQIGVAGVDLSSSEPGLSRWLAQGFHGDMAYMAAHGAKRARPAELVPGTVSVITARMDYLPGATPDGWQAIELARLQRPSEGIVSVYARGRDYHKVLRARLQKLADRIAAEVGPFGHRVFTDSAPVMEVELAAQSGIGWRGKHTLLLHREAGSMFFLGEVFVDFALPATGGVGPAAAAAAGAPLAGIPDGDYWSFDPISITEYESTATEKIANEKQPGHCGNCTACMDVCPTRAILSPGLLDARRCISYLTIEHQGSIPVELRPLMGNRIYGCDDCQLVCPWNKFAQRSALPDFDEREGLSGQQLTTLFSWTEDEFLRHTEGSPIRRIGHERWLRNVAVALGNALRSQAGGGISADEAAALRGALTTRIADSSLLVRDHVAWALAAI